MWLNSNFISDAFFEKQPTFEIRVTTHSILKMHLQASDQSVAQQPIASLCELTEEARHICVGVRVMVHQCHSTFSKWGCLNVGEGTVPRMSKLFFIQATWADPVYANSILRDWRYSEKQREVEVVSCTPLPSMARLLGPWGLGLLPSSGIQPIRRHAHNKHQHDRLPPESSLLRSREHGIDSWTCSEGRGLQSQETFWRQFRDTQSWTSSALRRSQPYWVRTSSHSCTNDFALILKWFISSRTLIASFLPINTTKILEISYAQILNPSRKGWCWRGESNRWNSDDLIL